MTAEAQASRAAARAPSGARRRRVPLETFVHLVWLVFLGFQPIFDPTAGGRDVLVIVGIVAVFLPVYFWTWSRPSGRAALPGIAMLGVMGAVLPPINSGATTSSFTPPPLRAPNCGRAKPSASSPCSWGSRSSVRGRRASRGLTWSRCTRPPSC